MGIASRKSNAIPAPSPMCDSNPKEMIGRAKTGTGLASSMIKASPILPSKCIRSIARKTSTNANLTGSPVQKAGQRTPSPIFVGDMDSRSSVIRALCGLPAPRAVQELAIDDGRHGEQSDGHHHDDPADESDRALENIALRIFVDER